MISKRETRPAPTMAGQAVALAWGAWTELGVSGWTATHGDWAIDPEPLILLTAFLGDRDPRLRDEVTDWCIHHWRYISKTRLRNLLGRQPARAGNAFGEFAATVAAHAPVTWPGATQPRRYTPTGRSALPPLERPSLVWLRLRAMFGVGARSEILRTFLAQSDVPMSAARLAEATSYTKRNIAEECENLQRAGVLSCRTVGNRFDYRLARRSELEAFVGVLPDLRPDWTSLVRIATELVALEEQVATAAPRTLPVKARQTLDRIEPDLVELDIEAPPGDLRGPSLWPAVETLAARTLAAWSTGAWPDGKKPSSTRRRTATADTALA